MHGEREQTRGWDYRPGVPENSWLRGASEPRADAGSGHPDVLEAEIEHLRQRCLREAEQRHHMELRRLRREDVGSYRTASSGGPGGVADQPRPVSMEERGGHQAGADGLLITTPGAGMGRGTPTPVGSWGLRHFKGV